MHINRLLREVNEAFQQEQPFGTAAAMRLYYLYEVLDMVRLLDDRIKSFGAISGARDGDIWEDLRAAAIRLGRLVLEDVEGE